MPRVRLDSLTNPTQRMIYMVDYHTDIRKFNSEAETIGSSFMGGTLV